MPEYVAGLCRMQHGEPVLQVGLAGLRRPGSLAGSDRRHAIREKLELAGSRFTVVHKIVASEAPVEGPNQCAGPKPREIPSPIPQEPRGKPPP
jgi:hypothetical protein